MATVLCTFASDQQTSLLVNMPEQCDTPSPWKTLTQ